MSKYQAFIGDSGTAPALAVFAGFVSTLERWKSFCNDWQYALARSPAVSYRQMQDAALGQSGFQSLSEDNRKQKIYSLINVINSHAIYGVQFAIEPDSAPNPVNEWGQSQEDFSYFYGATVVMLRVLANQYRQGLSGEVDFIFAERSGPQAAILDFWELMKRQHPRKDRRRMGNPPRWNSDREFIPLQAADFLSSTGRRLMAQFLSGEPAELDRKLIKAMPSALKIPVDTAISDRDAVERFAAGLASLNAARRRQAEPQPADRVAGASPASASDNR